MIFRLVRLLFVLPITTVRCIPLDQIAAPGPIAGKLTAPGTQALNIDSQDASLWNDLQRDNPSFDFTQDAGIEFFTQHINIENCGERENDLRYAFLIAMKWVREATKEERIPKQFLRPYQAFFKDHNELDIINLLTSIKTMRKIEHLLPDRKASAPTFLCATPDTPKHYQLPFDVWDACDGHAEYLQGYKYVIICPAWFGLPLLPEISGEDGCPEVNSKRNRFMVNEADIVYNRPLVLVHELVHFYLGPASLDTHSEPAEVYYLNQCVGLSAYNSARNPNNYQAYIGSKSPVPASTLDLRFF